METVNSPPTPTPPTQLKPPELALAEPGARERIMQAAIGLFSRHGFDATPVREIVRAAGVTKPVLYYYFKNKEDLFQEIITESLGAFGVQFRAICGSAEDDRIATAADFHALLAGIAEIYFSGARRQPDLVRFIHSIFFSGLFERVFDFHTVWLEEMSLIANVFERAQVKGFIRRDVPSSVMANHFMGIVLHWMKGIVFCPETLPSEPDAALIVRVLMQGISPAAPSSDTSVQ